MKWARWVGCGLLACCLSSGFAWNGNGHQLIAQIALMQLTADERHALSQESRAYHVGYQPHTLTQAAAWLDWLHCKAKWCQFYHYYHYIDLPYSIDGTLGEPPRAQNALFAIDQARQILNSHQTSMQEKGFQLRVLMHVVGDIHQPLHTISLYSRQFPHGDQGGNLFLLGKNHVAPRLHAYWDRGGGRLIKRMALKKQAARLLKRYPCPLDERIDPAAWVQESHHLARDRAYHIAFGERPSHRYQRMVERTTDQRLTVAGCRLAMLLKKPQVIS